MNAHTRRGISLLVVAPPLNAFFRGMAFFWLDKADIDRRIAALAGRSRGPELAGIRRVSLEAARAGLRTARDRQAKARAYGHRLP